MGEPVGVQPALELAVQQMIVLLSMKLLNHRLSVAISVDPSINIEPHKSLSDHSSLCFFQLHESSWQTFLT